MGLRGYLVKRSINSVILLFFVITMNFAIFQLMPGLDGAIANLVSNPAAGRLSEAQKQALIKQYGFCVDFTPAGDCIPASIWDRFSVYFVNMLTFDFGFSSRTGLSVTDELIASGRLINTLTLIGIATVVALTIGVLLGVVAAARRGSIFDSGSVLTSLLTGSLPTFFMGILFIIFFADFLGWFPTGGVTPSINPYTNLPWIESKPPPLEQLLVRLQHLFLPALTLTLFFYGGNLLLARATTLETLSDDYVTTARAKGLKERTVLFKHVLKNASLPIITVAALNFGFIMAGAIITETVFNWDGLGLWLFTSIGWKDFPVMQAMFYIIALQVIIANLVADIIYGWVDPRIRYQ